MSSIVASPSADEQRKKLAAIKPKPVQARLDFRVAIGKSIQRAIAVAGWSNKEAAGRIWPHLDIDTSQAKLSKYIAGTETPKFELLLDVEELRWPLIESLALISDACQMVSGFYRRPA